MESNHTKGKLSLQGPKIQDDFGNQTYYTFRIENGPDALGFFYPKSPKSPEQMQADAERIVHCVNSHHELVEALKGLYEFNLNGNGYLDQLLNDAESILLKTKTITNDK